MCSQNSSSSKNEKTYLVGHDRRCRARGTLLHIGLGLGIVHDCVGRFLIFLWRLLVDDPRGIGLGELGRLDGIGDRRGRKRGERRGRTGVESR